MREGRERDAKMLFRGEEDGAKSAQAQSQRAQLEAEGACWWGWSYGSCTRILLGPNHLIPVGLYLQTYIGPPVRCGAPVGPKIGEDRDGPENDT